MLDFEEELKKFQPSLEVEELGDAIYQDDLTDMTDLLREVIEQTTQIYLKGFELKERTEVNRMNLSYVKRCGSGLYV